MRKFKVIFFTFIIPVFCYGNWESVQLPPSYNTMQTDDLGEGLMYSFGHQYQVQASEKNLFVIQNNEVRDVTPSMIGTNHTIINCDHLGNQIALFAEQGQIVPYDDILNPETTPRRYWMYLSDDLGSNWTRYQHDFIEVFDVAIFEDCILIIARESDDDRNDQFLYRFSKGVETWEKVDRVLASRNSRPFKFVQNTGLPYVFLHSLRDNGFVYTEDGFVFQNLSSMGLANSTDGSSGGAEIQGDGEALYCFQLDFSDFQFKLYQFNFDDNAWSHVTADPTNVNNEIPSDFEVNDVIATNGLVIIRGLTEDIVTQQEQEVYLYSQDVGASWTVIDSVSVFASYPGVKLPTIHNVDGAHQFLDNEFNLNSSFVGLASVMQISSIAPILDYEPVQLWNASPHKIHFTDNGISLVGSPQGVLTITDIEMNQWELHSSNLLEKYRSNFHFNARLLDRSSNQLALYYFRYNTANFEVDPNKEYLVFQQSDEAWYEVNNPNHIKILIPFQDKLLAETYNENFDFIGLSYAVAPFNDWVLIENTTQLPKGELKNYKDQFIYIFELNDTTDKFTNYESYNLGISWAKYETGIGLGSNGNRYDVDIAHPLYQVGTTVYNVNTLERVSIDSRFFGFRNQHALTSHGRFFIKFANNQYHAFTLMGNQGAYPLQHFTSTDLVHWTKMEHNLPADLKILDMHHFNDTYFLLTENRGIYKFHGEPEALPTSIINSFNTENKFLIYPNPVIDRFTVDLDDYYKEVTVQLLTINGQLLFEQVYRNKKSLSIKLPDVADNSLVIHVKSEERSESHVISVVK